MPSPSTVLGNSVVTMPADTTSNRPGVAGGTLAGVSPIAGMIRFNTSFNLMEYYNGTIWKAIDAPPLISSVSPTSYSGASGTTITINGTNFQSGAVAAFISAQGTVYNAATTTVVNSSQITAVTPQGFLVSQSPLSVQVTNVSGLYAILSACLTDGSAPTWSTASGNILNVFDSARTVSVTVTATDADGSVTYSIPTGNLPTGLSLNAATGTISGTASSVGSDTTSSFTLRATDSAGNTVDRAFSITVYSPKVVSFTATGSSSWTVPTNLTSVQLLLVGGGGGGGASTGFETGGGGGAGGLIYNASFPVAPGGSIPYTVGAGGSPIGATASAPGSLPSSQGSNTVFGPQTAYGGGYGGGQYWYGTSGGSGGGGAGNYTPNNAAGTPGQGNPGGYGYNNGDASLGGGGGGAGGAGQNSPSGTAGYGGVGLSYSITGSPVYYAGGGGGGGNPGGNGGPGGAGGGGNGSGGGSGGPGGTNLGGGGGGCRAGAGTPSGSGGPGVIIVKY
jgi:hypothetical protein